MASAQVDNVTSGSSGTDPNAALLTELEALLGAPAVIRERDLMVGYAEDVTGRFHGRPVAVARPQNSEQVKRAVSACARHHTPLVPQGGNTGLVGAGVPRDGELVLSLRALDRVGEIDHDACQIEVEAGAVLSQVQAAAAEADLELPIDHGARSAATIGGMVATDAGGPLALRHGSMRDRVSGLEVVLANGSVIRRMSGLPKDNAGYDLVGLMVGSEGTLGVVTGVRLRLIPRRRFRVTALFGVTGVDQALRLLRRLRSIQSLEAADIFDGSGMELGCAHRSRESPLSRPYPNYVVADCAAMTDPTEELAATVAGDLEVVAATDTAGRNHLWSYREVLNEAIGAAGVPHKLDVGVPVAAMPAFDREIRRQIALANPSWKLYVYGHLGDGNFHLNIIGPAIDDEAADEIVFRCVAGFGGTISAEHGVGIAKKRWLPLCRTDADIEAMLGIKRALDPARTLSPGRVLAELA